MTLMMLAKQQAALDIATEPARLQLVTEQNFLKELFLQPQRHRLAERLEPARRKSKIGGEQPLEFQERLVVKGNVVDALIPDAAGFQAIAHGIGRKSGVMLLAAETL